MRLDPSQPFVLIDAAAGGQARLYHDLRETVRADRADQVVPALERLRGHEAAGFLSYEAGAALQPRLAMRDAPLPLLWFGLFDGCDVLPEAEVAALLPDPAGAWIGRPRPEIDRAAYGAAFARVHDWIEAGDIYQANLTFRAAVRVLGDPLAAYAAVRRRAAAGHGALVWTGRDWLLSFSPERFFAVEGRVLTARPMKGTTRRGETLEDDRRLRDALAADAKQRAENLMIVDLMRNDLARVAIPGSVAVPELFRVERYPTVHQMTSTVTAEIAAGRDAVDVLTQAFPCGSVTGAPKLRAMAVIGAVERDARGIYTGAIGWIGADGDAAFNVAIRTLHLPAGAEQATMGLGSGIVADSRVDEEWAECDAKGGFLTAGQRGVDLIETMAFDPEVGVVRLERHLARMTGSAAALGFAFDRHMTRNELQAATFRLRRPARLRLLLAPSGAIAIEVAPLPAPVDRPVTVAVVPLPVDAADWRLRHKTSDRRFYDRARTGGATREVVFARPDAWLTEGSFTSLFVPRDGRLVTPPLARGLLPGVLRAELIDAGRAVEGDLTIADLAEGFFVGNAVRGLMPAVLAVAESGGPTL